MRPSEIAEVYARALFDLAAASDGVDAADEGIAATADAIRGHVELRDTLADASVDPAKKREIVREVFGDVVVPEVVAVASMIVDRGRVDMLGEVARRFREIAEKERGIVVAEVTTAVPLDDASRATIVQKLNASMGRPVTLRERVDESILGGVLIKVGGRVLDGSLSSQLTAMRVALASTQEGEGARG